MKKTVTKAHHKIFRAVAGAVINTAHGHPKWHITTVMAESIAKRATGTLTAEWPEVLAAHKPSESADDRQSRVDHWPPLYRSTTRSGKREGGLAELRRGSPFSRKLIKYLSYEAGQARRSGKTERMEALVDVLRFVAKIKN